MPLAKTHAIGFVHCTLGFVRMPVLHHGAFTVNRFRLNRNALPSHALRQFISRIELGVLVSTSRPISINPMNFSVR